MKVSASLEFLRCLRCGGKTRIRVREDTVLRNLPLYCPKCGYECIIAYENRKLYIVSEPDAADR